MSDEFQKIWQLFLEKTQASREVIKYTKKLNNKTADYSDAQKYSSILSDLLIESASEVYPTNSENVLNTLKNTSLCKSYFNRLDNYVYSLQKMINEANGLGINAVTVNKIPQLIKDGISFTDDYDRDIRRYSSSAEHASNARVDLIQRTNAKFQSNVGYKITVSRKYDGKGLSDGRVCKWCLERVGSNLPYKEAYERGMFERHEGCHCVIEYNNGGQKLYQSAKGGQSSWSSQQDWMAKKQIELRGKKLSVHDSKIYDKIRVQTNTLASQNTAGKANEIINVQKKYGDIEEIIILKNNSLGGIAAYDHANNTLYLSEELGNESSFKKIVDSKKFPAKNLEDVIEHELGGHKKHWDSVKAYSNEKGVSISSSKLQLEAELRKFIISQSMHDPFYIERVVSTNAFNKFISKKELNELIADTKVRISQNTLDDNFLKELVLEVINYDGRNS